MKQNKHLLVTIVCLLVVATFALNAQNYKLPEYTSFKLDNGLTINLMEQHEVPVISVSAILPAGAIYDENKPGLASLTAASLKHGTAGYSKATLDEELDFMGASINTYASKESAGLSSKFASRDKEKVLKMIKELLVSPTFPPDEFEKEKKRLLVRLEQQKESPRGVISIYFDKFFYGDHVYANAIQGNRTSVNILNVEDIRTFFLDNYSPEAAAISVVGDFSSEEMKNILTSLFRDWKPTDKLMEDISARAPEFPRENQVLLVNKEDATETTFLIGAPGISRNNPDFVAIDVINTLFGGRFTSMLNEELRVKTGLTYGAGSNFRSLKNWGSFVISTFTATETTEQAIDKALEVLNNLHSSGLNENSLTSAKNYVKGQFPPQYETTAQLASLLSQMFWYELDSSYINDFESNVDSLDVSKAQELAGKYFPKDQLQFVLIGKALEIRPIAEKYGKVTEIEIKNDLDKSL